MNQKACFFIGHSDASERVAPAVFSAIERLIAEFEVDQFYVGGYGSFDRIVTAELQRAKALHPGIKLYLVLPYHPAERPFLLPAGFDSSIYPFDVAPPRKYAIIRANELMIRECGYLIAYAKYVGKARDFTEFARKHGVAVFNIAEEAE